MENKKEIGTETVREIVNGEQYTIRPGDDGYYIDDYGNPYEIALVHNGEEWTVNARIFSDNEEHVEEVISSGQFFNMLPRIRNAFKF